MNQKDFESPRIHALTLDEEKILSVQLMASAARGPMRRASLEDLVIEGNREARHRLILFIVVLAVLCMA
jgi:hypothetical protein